MLTQNKKIKYGLWVLFVILLGAAVWGIARLGTRSNNSLPAALQGLSSFDWYTGDLHARAVLIEYGDFQCPACGAYYPLVKQILQKYGKDILFVYRHFPLSQHQWAKPAAYAAEAAGAQGKFWEMYAMLFENQNQWEEQKDAGVQFLEYAKTLKLNIIKFKNDSASEKTDARIRADYESGLASGINATPTFFLNNKRIQPKDYEEFEKQIKSVLN